jgi:hypothetical protein
MAKIIANRLKPFLCNLILSNQGGFVEKRKYGIISFWCRRPFIRATPTRGKGMIIKIDMANAFDRVKHNFLNAVLKNLASIRFLSPRLVLVSTIPGFLLWSMVGQSPFFKATRGLRQGCPLSPLLYVLLAESSK